MIYTTMLTDLATAGASDSSAFAVHNARLINVYNMTNMLMVLRSSQ